MREIETQSGGQGKDTQLGELERALTSSAQGPFSLGQVQYPCGSAVSPADPRGPLARWSGRTGTGCVGSGQALGLAGVQLLETLHPAGM